MRTDLFQDRKCVHVKLEKDTHAAFRTRLFTHNLSMQEVFEAFANLVVRGDSRANKIVENIIVKKVEAQIDGKIKRRRKKEKVSENERDVLYNMIEGHDDAGSD